MSRRSRTRRVLKWVGVAACLLVGVTWLLSVRWQIWYAWKAEILTPDDTRLLGIAQGGVIYRAFHASSMDDYLIADLGWHRASASVDFGFRRPTIASGRFRTTAWFPLCPALVAVSIFTFVVWIWPRRQTPGYCRRCGYNLTGNISGVCPECGEPT